MTIDARPKAYQVLVELGWRWFAGARVDGLHLCPPAGDVAHCGAAMPRHARMQVTTGIRERGCRRCLAGAGIEVPS